MGTLVASCPRCPGELVVVDGPWVCEEHGDLVPLWCAEEASYDGFVEQLRATGGCPTYLPWPAGAGWVLSEHGWVARPGQDAVATMARSTVTREPDGPVEMLVVCEEPGVGLGARCAGVSEHAPGPELWFSPPALRVRLGRQQVALWSLPVSGVAADADRSVLVGEHGGRWLWVVLWPASAVLGLQHWRLDDAAALGPRLIELPFAGSP